MVTATLDQGSSQLQNWTTLPEICKIDAPFTPISSISTDKRTLNCNIGNHKQGSKLGFSALAGVNTRAKSKDLVNVAITAKGDLGLVSTPFKSKDTIVTGNFSIDLDKSVPSDRSKPEYPGNYAVPSQKGPTGEDGRLINYTIVLNTAKGSEGILPDTGKTTKTFNLTDVFSDNNNGDGTSIPGSTSNAQLINWDGKQGCVKAGVAITGVLTCIQSGNSIAITVNDVDLSSPDAIGQVFKFNIFLWVPTTDINQGGATTLIIRNDISGIDGIVSATALQNNNTGIENISNNGLDLIIEQLPIGDFQATKNIYGNSYNRKPGTKKVSPSEIFPVNIGFESHAPINYSIKICDNIDTSKVEFVGKSLIAQKLDYMDYVDPGATLYKNNPSLNSRKDGNSPNGVDVLGMPSDGVIVEYSVLPHVSTLPEDLMVSKCNDDLDSNGSNDWTSTIPSNPALVSRVRFSLDFDKQKLQSKYGFNEFNETVDVNYNFDVKVKAYTPPGTQIPNFAVVDKGNNTWGFNANNYGDSTSTDITNPKFSLSSLLADRVTVVGATVGIAKDTVPSNLGVIQAGDVVEWELQPQANGPVPTPANPTITITDTPPDAMTYVDGSTTVISPEGTLTGPVVSGQTLTWTWNNINFADGSNPKIRFKAKSDKDVVSATYLNNVSLTTDSLQINQDSDPACSGCTSPFSPTSSKSVKVVPVGSYQIEKENEKEVYEVNKLFKQYLTYRNNSSTNYTAGDFIDIFPFNGDSGLDVNRETTIVGGSGASNYTEKSSDSVVGLASLPIGINGEVFQYATVNPSTINHDPCHISNQPISYVPVAGDYCYQYFSLYNTLPGGLLGTGTTIWSNTPPADLKDITAIRFSTTAHNANTATRKVELNFSPKGNVENNVYCNSFSGRIPEISLDIRSNDVCERVVSGVISGQVWKDANLSGTNLPDTGETFFAGTVVKLLKAEGTPYIDPNTDLPMQTTTDASGKYEFKELPSGDYKVVVEGISMPQTYDLDDGGNVVTYATINDSGTVTISPVIDLATTKQTEVSDKALVNFSYNPIGKVGNYVWYDENGDGIQDATELPVPDGTAVKLTYFGADGVLGGIDDEIFNTTTLAGNYLFEKLPFGKFQVEVTSPTNTSQTFDKDGIVTVNISNTELTATAPSDLTQDFGFKKLLSIISGTVYQDTNNDGNKDASESAQPGVTITLSGVDDLGATVSLTLSTDDAGYYEFSNLRPGTYTVTETQPTFLLDGKDTVGVGATTQGVMTNDTQTGIVLKLGDISKGNNFGEVIPSEISGKVFIDKNKSKDVDGMENYVVPVGAKAVLKDSMGNVIKTVDIDLITGGYKFDNLYPAMYSVEVLPLAGYTFTSLSSVAVNLKAGDKTVNSDTGLWKPSSLGDYVWNDVNGNGIQDDTEKGVEGITVTLKKKDGTIVASTKTDKDGKYMFDNLVMGDYYVELTNLSNIYEITKLESVGATNINNSDFDQITKVTKIISLGFDEKNINVDAGLLVKPKIALEVKDPYICGKGFYGIVVGGLSPKVKIILSQNGNLKYTFDAVLIDGKYEYLIDTADSTKINYVAEGMYDVLISATDMNSLLVSTDTLKADIKSKCTPDLVRTGGEFVDSNYSLINSLGLLALLMVAGVFNLKR